MDGSVMLTDSGKLPKKGEKKVLELQKHALEEVSLHCEEIFSLNELNSKN